MNLEPHQYIRSQHRIVEESDKYLNLLKSQVQARINSLQDKSHTVLTRNPHCTEKKRFLQTVYGCIHQLQQVLDHINVIIKNDTKAPWSD